MIKCHIRHEVHYEDNFLHDKIFQIRHANKPVEKVHDVLVEKIINNFYLSVQGE